MPCTKRLSQIVLGFNVLSAAPGHLRAMLRSFEQQARIKRITCHKQCVRERWGRDLYSSASAHTDTHNGGGGTCVYTHTHTHTDRHMKEVGRGVYSYVQTHTHL